MATTSNVLATEPAMTAALLPPVPAKRADFQ